MIEKSIRWTMILMSFMCVMCIQSCEDSVEPRFRYALEREFDIPINLNTIETHYFELKNISSLYDLNLDVNGMREEDVVSVSPGEGYVTGGFSNVDWSFIRWMEVYVVSRVDNTRRSRVFYSNEPDLNDRSQVGLFNTFADVKDIFAEGTFDLEIRLRIRNFVPGNVDARIVMEFAVFDE